jgi:hypothetical protein
MATAWLTLLVGQVGSSKIPDLEKNYNSVVKWNIRKFILIVGPVVVDKNGDGNNSVSGHSIRKGGFREGRINIIPGGNRSINFYPVE